MVIGNRKCQPFPSLSSYFPWPWVGGGCTIIFCQLLHIDPGKACFVSINIMQFIMRAHNRVHYGHEFEFVCLHTTYLIIMIIQTCLKALNIPKAFLVQNVECVQVYYLNHRLCNIWGSMFSAHSFLFWCLVECVFYLSILLCSSYRRHDLTQGLGWGMRSMAERKTVVASLVIIKCRDTGDGYTITHIESYTLGWNKPVELLISITFLWQRITVLGTHRSNARDRVINDISRHGRTKEGFNCLCKNTHQHSVGQKDRAMIRHEHSGPRRRKIIFMENF